MEFRLFLQDLEKQNNCTGSAELFAKLGGEDKLGIALRTFRAIASGQIPPSLKFFSALFRDLPKHMKKSALVSYFESSVEDVKQRVEITSFIEEQTAVAISDNLESLFKKEEAYFFSEKQLQYLASSNEVIRTYERMLCHWGLSEMDLAKQEIKTVAERFVDLDIAEKKDRKIVPSKYLYRLPHQDNSPRELVRSATDFILRHLSAFIAKEGSPGEQELGFSFHTCRRRDAELILEQMGHFKRWVQNFGLTRDEPDEVSFVWVDFGRILRKDRDY